MAGRVEAVAAARPDLVLDAFSDELLHGTLSALAPTIQLKVGEDDSCDTAQLLAGRACGEEAAADAAVAATRDVLLEQSLRLQAHRGGWSRSRSGRATSSSSSPVGRSAPASSPSSG